MKNTKILIIYGNDLEQAEKEFNDLLNAENNISSDIKNINDVSIDEIKKYDIVLNRVYASTANSNPNIRHATVDLISKI
jgi:hypothetical protein